MLYPKIEHYLKKEVDIRAWLEQHYIYSYSVIQDSVYGYVVDSHQSVNLTGLKRGLVPIKFREINGDFICSGIGLSNLDFAPKKVSYKFDCSHNNLTSLKGAPEFVGKGFDCSRNMLTTLRFSPLEARGKFDCSYNQISSLDGVAPELDALIATGNALVNLMYSPNNIKGDFVVNHNRLKTLDGCPEFIGGSFLVGNNELSELDFFPNFIGAEISLQHNRQLGEVQNYHEFKAIYNEYQKLKIEKEKIYMEECLPILDDRDESNSGRGKI